MFRTAISKRPVQIVFVWIALVSSSLTASIIQSNANLPPLSGSYSFAGTLCAPLVCLANMSLNTSSVVNTAFAAGNQTADLTGQIQGDLYQNAGGGALGSPLGLFTVPGTFSFSYLGRTSNTQLGTFATLVTAFQFAGSYNGSTFLLQLNPGQTSSGTTFVSLLGPDQYLVDSTATVFGQLSINGGPFVNNPGRGVSLQSAVPEPSTAGLIGVGLIALGLSVRRSRSPKQN